MCILMLVITDNNMETYMAVLNGALSPFLKWCDYLVLVHCYDKSVIVKLVKFVRNTETNYFSFGDVMCAI
jgi:hypothetical protein